MSLKAHHIKNLKALCFSVLALPLATLNATEMADTLALDDVVVTGARTVSDTRHIPFTVDVVTRERLNIENQQSILPAIFEHVPGIFVTGRGMTGYGISTGGSRGISFRGLSASSGQMLVLIDGHPQYSGIYGHPISDAYRSIIADKVEVLRGPASVVYGSNAIGGVVNIVTRKMNEDGIRNQIRLGGGSYGTATAEASNSIKRGKFSSTIAGEYLRSDNHRERMEFEEVTGHLNIGYEINSSFSLYANADLTHFNAEYPGSIKAPIFGAKQWITRGESTIGLTDKIGKFSGGVSAFTNFGIHKIDDGSSSPTSPTDRYFRSKDNLAGVSAYQSANLFEGNTITVGLDYQHIYGHAYYTSKETGAVIDTPNKLSGKSHRNEIGAYADIRQDLSRLVTIDAGLRFDRHSVSGSEWIPQVGLVVRPIEEGTIKAMYSKGFRNPTMRELYLYPPSNEELRPESINNFEISWQHRLSKISYGLNLFYLKGNNMIQQAVVDGRPKNINTGVIENTGVEGELKYNISSALYISTNHSLLHMHNHVLAAPIYKGALSLGGRASRFSYTLGTQFINNLFTIIGKEQSAESFVLVNANIGYTVNKMLKLWARGENLLAQKYSINDGYPMPRATFMAGIELNF